MKKINTPQNISTIKRVHTKKAHKIATLEDAFLIKLNALYDVENQLVKALPKMAEAASDPDLKQGFTDHLAETREHVRRLEEAYMILGIEAEKTKVEAIRGLVKDADWIVGQKPEKNVLDAQLIAAASYVEHYEMAGYIAARRWAVKLGFSTVASLLENTLDEENAAAQKLASLADEKIDQSAIARVMVL